ncbi:hypothetical protein CASFOL_020731 [Castilleja foliolosa]|uniref:Nodule Cysteine-Rich (NCR) secreted peptide n=1 Tax=Castilleja foliolosa TaxID=1961234 RepID=A0ABD3D4H5_9LAMI
MASQKLILFFAFFFIAQGLMVFAYKYPPVPCETDDGCANAICPEQVGKIHKCVNGICICIKAPHPPSRDGGI